MKFTKMHGIGNDYIYVDGAAEVLADPAGIARRVSDRHKGIGGDGLIIIRPPTGPGAAGRMEMYNADGSRAQMCGNGIRCVAKWLIDRGRAAGPEIAIETDCRSPPAPGRWTGARRPGGARRGGHGGAAAPPGGDPLRRRRAPDAPAVDVPLEAAGRTVRVTAVSMGNPHCVIRLRGAEPFGARLADLDLAAIGPPFERHPAFPERTNVEFIEPRSRTEIDFRVWERGSGETRPAAPGLAPPSSPASSGDPATGGSGSTSSGATSTSAGIRRRTGSS